MLNGEVLNADHQLVIEPLHKISIGSSSYIKAYLNQPLNKSTLGFNTYNFGEQRFESVYLQLDEATKEYFYMVDGKKVKVVAEVLDADGNNIDGVLVDGRFVQTGTYRVRLTIKFAEGDRVMEIPNFDVKEVLVGTLSTSSTYKAVTVNATLNKNIISFKFFSEAEGKEVTRYLEYDATTGKYYYLYDSANTDAKTYIDMVVYDLEGTILNDAFVNGIAKKEGTYNIEILFAHEEANFKFTLPNIE